jgi:hypothetical protein
MTSLGYQQILSFYSTPSQIYLLIPDVVSSILRLWLPVYVLPCTPLPQHILQSRVIRNVLHWLSVVSFLFPVVHTFISLLNSCHSSFSSTGVHTVWPREPDRRESLLLCKWATRVKLVTTDSSLCGVSCGRA